MQSGPTASPNHVSRLRLPLPDGRAAHLRLNHEALTLSIDELLVYTFDLAGRLYGAFDHGVNYRRGLDGRMLARWREDGRRQRRWLGEEEVRAFLERMRGDVESIRKAIFQPFGGGRAETGEHGDESQVAGRRSQVNPFPTLDIGRWTLDIPNLLERVVNFDYDADVQRFHQVYRPISILPPDQYQALVLQATEGCSFNTCTFCALYRDRPFRIKSPDEFEKHVADVLDFFGPGVSMRRSIFLADANALVIPQRRLLPLMTIVARTFPILPEDASAEARRAWLRRDPRAMTGVFAFVDGLSAERKSVEDFRELWALGLRRVYIGLESGHEPLLAWLRKPSTAAEMVDAVGRMKAAGLQVGVIVLLGVGGRRFDQGHVADTAAALNAMSLDGKDIIYFSPFEPDPRAPYLSIARAEGVDLPTPDFMDSQRERILARLTLPPPPAGPRRVPYNLADFVY